ncbi:MAG: formylmethanofuran dehydrogenase subunit C [Isosphaeraceae bacterium]
MALTLCWRGATSLAVDGSPINPVAFRDRSADEVRRARLRVGNTTTDLDDLFHVHETGDGSRLMLEGDLSHVHGLARGMSAGDLMLHGEAGCELGAGMTGGSIEVAGSVGDWAGAEMRGGKIHIQGNAGSFLGAAYPGSRLGMREGVILVEGSVGDDAGLLMRRGLVAIRGDAGGGLGRSMIAGTVLVLGSVGRRLGAGMKRGTLILPCLDDPGDGILLPSFARAGVFSAPFVTIYYRQLADWGFAVSRAVSLTRLERYNGDVVVGGHGEVLVGRRGA